MRIDAIEATVGPIVASLGLELFDVSATGSGRATTLRVTVDREGGVDLDAVAAATEAISPVLDASDLVRGPYTLEVTSPGLERVLRKPAQYRGALGATLSVKTRDAEGRAERIRGTLRAVDEDTFTLDLDGEARRLAFADVEQARTVFEWGPAPKPGGPRRRHGASEKGEVTRR